MTVQAQPNTSASTAAKERCAESFWVLQTMLKRESTTYSCQAITSETSGEDYAVLRSSLVDVMEEVCDHTALQDKHTVISIAVSYLDRFVQQQNQKNPNRFVHLQLAAMTCLYLSIKICDEPKKVQPDWLCNLYHQCTDCEDDVQDEDDEDEDDDFDAQDLQAMELEILKALEWNLNPPTAMMFARQILLCLPRLPELTSWTDQAKDTARLQLEVVARRETCFTHFMPSTLAVASLFSTVEQLPPKHDRTSIYKFLLQVVRMTSTRHQQQVLEARRLLKQHHLPIQTVATELLPCQQEKLWECSSSSNLEEHRPTKKQRTFGNGISAPLSLTSLASSMM